MTLVDFKSTLRLASPPEGLTAPLAALWWDSKGDWAHAHGLVDSLSTLDGMAVHAYLHRKEGAEWNADYWYSRAGRRLHRAALDEEWEALVAGLLAESSELSPPLQPAQSLGAPSLRSKGGKASLFPRPPSSCGVLPSPDCHPDRSRPRKRTASGAICGCFY